MRHVPHIYVPAPWVTDRLRLDGDQLHHLNRVLRLEEGEGVTYTDGAGRLGSGALEGDSIDRGEESLVERGHRLTLAVAPPDSKDRARFLVEKAAELGVARLRWLETVHGHGRPPRPDRSRAWAVSALEQSRGSWLMGIDEATATFSDLSQPVLVAAPGGRSVVPVGVDVTVAIGPEGGWASGEVPADATLLDLGPTILRVETAAIVAAARLLVADR